MIIFILLVFLLFEFAEKMWENIKKIWIKIIGMSKEEVRVYVIKIQDRVNEILNINICWILKLIFMGLILFDAYFLFYLLKDAKWNAYYRGSILIFVSIYLLYLIRLFKNFYLKQMDIFKALREVKKYDFFIAILSNIHLLYMFFKIPIDKLKYAPIIILLQILYIILILNLTYIVIKINFSDMFEFDLIKEYKDVIYSKNKYRMFELENKDINFIYSYIDNSKIETRYESEKTKKDTLYLKEKLEEQKNKNMDIKSKLKYITIELENITFIFTAIIIPLLLFLIQGYNNKFNDIFCYINILILFIILIDSSCEVRNKMKYEKAILFIEYIEKKIKENKLYDDNGEVK